MIHSTQHRSFVPYNKNYPKIFLAEKKRLQKSLGDISIEHFGSTAVPGLGGKGYIDIYISVPKNEMKVYSNKIQQLEYEHRPDGDVGDERIFHKRKSAGVTYNLHVTYLGAENLRTCKAFRNYLRAHPKDLKAYAKAKKEAAKIANNTENRHEAVQAYMKSKSDIIQKINSKARPGLGSPF